MSTRFGKHFRLSTRKALVLIPSRRKMMQAQDDRAQDADKIMDARFGA